MHHTAPIVEEIFLAALAIEGPEARSSYLDAACGDPELRRRVERLLALDTQASGFLERPPAALGLTDTQGFTGPEAATESASDDADVVLDFLGPSNQEGSLGRLGTYEVQAVVGRGGMGIVLKALDTRLNRTVALKVLAPELAANATARKRFQREAQAAAAVAHPHVVTIHAVEEDRLPYLVMELIQGISLRDKIEREGPLPLTEILRMGSQVAAGLAAAHKQGLIHRDIKPANILLENGVQRVKVTDFGLARAVDDVDISQTGEVSGTPLYMSPEQAEGLPLDARSDLFSLGSVLYTMCTGRSPFRADTAVAVLRRVCDATPRPIREVNPEIPQWLCATIDRLLAKDPEARYQSAQEVSDLLSQFLAHLQQHSAAQLPVAYAPSLPTPRRLRIGARSWGAAAAILLLVAAGLGATEATGVTHLSTMIIRILVPGGTLVVETDDPDVQVTIEGDGGLVITGAGSQEVRLRPGSYQVHSSKAGKPVPLDRDLVTITRGDKQVVKVRIEGEPPATAKVAAISGAPPFVLLGGKGDELRRFATLVEAVQGSSDGDTVEIHGNGPFVTRPVEVRHALTIRAAAGFRPVIRLSPDIADQSAALINNQSPLALEGLELWGAPLTAATKDGWRVVVHAEWPLYIANCRLVGNGSHRMIQVPPLCRLTNCEILSGQGTDVVFQCEDRARWTIENCVFAGPEIGIRRWAPGMRDIHVEFASSVFLASKEWFALDIRMPPDQDRGKAALAIEVSKSIVRAYSVVEFTQYDSKVQGVVVEEIDLSARRTIRWSGAYNGYAPAGGFLSHKVNGQRVYPASIKQLDEWRQFWGSAEPGCIQGSVKFQGGDLLARAETDPAHLTPDDFRLRPDSAGYRASPDSKDLGADIEFLGPGPAYERWKKTPAYQEWLKDTGLSTRVSKKNVLRAETDTLLGQPGPEAKIKNLHRVAVARANSADKLRQQGLFDEAITAARDAIRLDPDLAQAHQNLGSALLAKKDWDGASAAYRAAIRLEPDDPVNHRELAVALQEGKGLNDEAITELRAVVRLRPYDFCSHRALIRALRAERKLDETVTTIREALRWIPNNAPFECNLAWSLGNAADPLRRNPAEALEFARRAVSHRPDDGDARLALGLAEYRSGHWKEARNTIERAMALHHGERYGESADLVERLLLALALAKEGERDRATTWFAKAVDDLKAMEPDEDADQRLRFWRQANNADRLIFWAEAAELLGEPGPYGQLPGDGPPRPPIAEVAPK